MGNGDGSDVEVVRWGNLPSSEGTEHVLLHCTKLNESSVRRKRKKDKKK